MWETRGKLHVTSPKVGSGLTNNMLLKMEIVGVSRLHSVIAQRDSLD
jgi:hypothetical protein